MTLSKLIAALEQQIVSHGDLVVAILDADTDYHLGIDRVEYDAKKHRVIIGGDYNTEATRVIDEEDARRRATRSTRVSLPAMRSDNSADGGNDGPQLPKV